VRRLPRVPLSKLQILSAAKHRHRLDGDPSLRSR